MTNKIPHLRHDVLTAVLLKMTNKITHLRYDVLTAVLLKMTNKITHFRYDVLTAVLLKIQVSWDAMPCHQGRRYQGVKGCIAFIWMGEKTEQKTLKYQQSVAQWHSITSKKCKFSRLQVLKLRNSLQSVSKDHSKITLQYKQAAPKISHYLTVPVIKHPAHVQTNSMFPLPCDKKVQRYYGIYC